MKFIHTADWHLRPDIPACRLDTDWEVTMRNLLQRFMTDLQKYQSDLDCAVELLIVGDIFNTSQQPAWVVNLFLSIIVEAIVFAGNHDFKHRNMDNIENSSIGHILKNPRYTACVAEKDEGFYQLTNDIMLCHRLVLQPGNSELAKFEKGIGVEELIELALEENKNVKWILVGDNHHHFHYESEEGIHVINPGIPMVQNAKMIGETCGYYFVDTDRNLVKFVEVKQDPTLLTDEYLRKEEAHSIGLRSIVEKLRNTKVEKVDFFGRCDDKSKLLNANSRNLYEDIRDEVIKMNNRKGV